jgi:hypothetical protein
LEEEGKEMKREQIIKILKEHSLDLKVHGEMFRNDSPEKYLWEAQFSKVADAIMALPLDVPTKEEAEDMATLYASEEGGEDFEQMLQQPDFIAFYDGAIKMRDDIIRRNK